MALSASLARHSLFMVGFACRNRPTIPRQITAASYCSLGKMQRTHSGTLQDTTIDRTLTIQVQVLISYLRHFLRSVTVHPARCELRPRRTRAGLLPNMWKVKVQHQLEEETNITGETCCISLTLSRFTGVLLLG